MTTTRHTDGTATYAATLPAALQAVTPAGPDSYTIGPNTYYVRLEDVPTYLSSAAHLIAVADFVEQEAEGKAEADRYLLASRLYADDAAKQTNAPEWADLSEADRKPYLDTAARLIAMGVKVNGL